MGRPEDPPPINCQGKEQLPQDRAADIAKRMSARHKTKIRPYRCPHCNHYHVGEVLGRKGNNHGHR